MKKIYLKQLNLPGMGANFFVSYNNKELFSVGVFEGKSSGTLEVLGELHPSLDPSQDILIYEEFSSPVSEKDELNAFYCAYGVARDFADRLSKQENVGIENLVRN